MEKKPPELHNKRYSVWFFLHGCDLIFTLTTGLSAFATSVMRFLQGPKSTLVYLCAAVFVLLLMLTLFNKKLLMQRGQKSDENLKSMLHSHTYSSLSKGPPIKSIRLEQCAETYIAFANAMNNIASDSDTFSEDDLSLISYLISKDKVLRKSLKRYKSMDQSVFATLLFILNEKGDFTRSQWAQMCKMLLKSMGEEPKSKPVREEMNLG